MRALRRIPVRARDGLAGALMRTGAFSDSSRSRSSLSKPFITERITMSAATPTHTPRSDAQVMKETKNLCERARTYRRPTYTDSGWNIVAI